MRVKCLAQEQNTMTRPGLEPGPQSSALTTRPPRLPHYWSYKSGILSIYAWREFLCIILTDFYFQFMVVTPSGAAGHAAAGHVTEELRTGHVPAPIPRLHTEDETAADWVELMNLANATHTTVQVKVLRKNTQTRTDELDTSFVMVKSANFLRVFVHESFEHD